MGSLKTLPGVIDTSARDAPGWDSVGNMSINGQTSFNFSYDGVTNKDTGLELGQLRRAGARLDRRSQGAGVELPGRVRPQLGRDDHRRHQERDARFPRHRGVLQAERGVQHEQLGSPAAVRCRPGGEAAPRPRTGSTTRRGPSAVRCWFRARRFNKNRDKLFFFFSQDLLPRNDPGTLQLSTMPTAARAQRRLLADASTATARSVSSATRCSSRRDCSATSTRAAPAASRTTAFLPNRINAIGQQMLEPVPAAECHRSGRHPAVQLHVPERAGEAAPRPGRARGLQHQPRHDVLHARAVRQRGELARRERVPRRRHRQRRQRRLAAVQHVVRSRLGQHGQHAAAHLQLVDGRRGHGRPQLGGAAGQPRRPGFARSQRSPRRPRRAGAVLPVRQPAVPRAADQLRRHQRAAEHARGRRRGSLSVQRQQHHLELLGEPLEDHGPAQLQGGRSSTSTRRGRRPARRSSTATSTSTATRATRSTPTSGSPTRCSDRSTATPSRRRSRTPRAGSTRPRCSCRTTGA